ncbi:RING-type domain-containing protein [Hirschfeldia incana]|nr:RING-type domain-containing protein [Hirschfeldia incana]
MLVQRRVMSWRRVWKSFQALLAHALLFSFTLLLALKLDRLLSHSWWFVFTPLWLFHAVIARGRFSLPAPSMPHDRHWAPFHSVMATPLLVAFEILLCVHLEDQYVVDLKIVFLPLLAFEVAILVDNVRYFIDILRMCRTLMPGDEETMSDEAIWETLPHFWVSISMVFFIAATTFTLLKLCGDVAALGWWDLFINFGIAECFAFLVCTKWSNQSIHRYTHVPEPSSSSMVVRYLDWNRGLVVTADEENQQSNRICGLQDIGGHVMKIPFITFQIILFMRLEGTPPSAKNIPILVLFVPLFLLQGAGVLFATYRLVEKSVLLITSGGGSFGRYFTATSSAREFLGFFQHGARLLGWWSIDEGSREEQARLYSGEATGYNTFSPDVVKKMPKSDLVEEIWRLQAALSEQTDITTYSQQEYEKLQNEKILCRVCFEDPINVVLLPCRHHVLCSTCCEKCKKCPICRVLIEERMPVYDV